MRCVHAADDAVDELERALKAHHDIGRSDDADELFSVENRER